MTPVRRARLPLLVRTLAFQWIAFLTPLAVLLLEVACLPTSWSWTTAAVFAGAMGLYLLLAMGGSVALLRTLGILLPADEDLAARVRRVCAERGAPVNRVFEADVHTANAAAFFASGDVMVTRPALALLSAAQLDAVFAHEAGHLRESAATRWTRIGSGGALLCLGLAIPTAGDFGLLAGVVGALVLTLALVAVARRLQRFERAADAHAHESAAAGHVEEGGFATALELLSEHNLTPAVLGRGLKSHPDVYDRMVDAGVEPSYPRPRPPARFMHVAGLLVTLVVCAALAVPLIAGQALASRNAEEPLLAMAVTGGTAWTVSMRLHGLDTDDPAARPLSDYVLEAARDDPWPLLSVARFWTAEDPELARAALEAAAALTEREAWGNWWLDLEIARVAASLGDAGLRDAWFAAARRDAATEHDRATVEEHIANIRAE